MYRKTMNGSKVSTKYQIVVPKKIRNKMKLMTGMTVRFFVVDDQRALLVREPHDHIKAMTGLGKEVWLKLGGADRYIKQERSSWDRKSV